MDVAALVKEARMLEFERKPGAAVRLASLELALQHDHDEVARRQLLYLLAQVAGEERERLVTHGLKETVNPGLQLELARTSPLEHRAALEALVQDPDLADRIRVTACIALWNAPVHGAESAEDMLVSLLIHGIDEEATLSALGQMADYGGRPSVMFLNTDADHLDPNAVKETLDRIRVRRDDGDLGGLSLVQDSSGGGLTLNSETDDPDDRPDD
jgi:hypothetical protein